METGTAGLYVAGHGFRRAVWDGKGDEKRAEERGEGGACVGFVVYDRCSPMFGEIFLLLFLWIGKEGGTDAADTVQSKVAPRNNKRSAMDDDVDDDDEEGEYCDEADVCVMRVCVRVVRVCLECGAENKKIQRIYGTKGRKKERKKKKGEALLCCCRCSLRAVVCLTD